MLKLTGLHPSRAGQGFTLIELLVAMILVLALAGAMVFNFSGFGRGAQLEEGGARLESLIRYSQAHAANTGRRVELMFEVAEDAPEMSAWVGTVKVLWEPDPLGAPGVFESLPEAVQHAQAVNELVFIEDVGQPGAAGMVSTNEAVGAASPSLGLDEALEGFFPPLIFNPDGSSDSAVIKLVSRDREDQREMRLRIEGITGALRREVTSLNADESAGEPAPQQQPAQTRPEKPARPTAPKPAATPDTSKALTR